MRSLGAHYATDEESDDRERLTAAHSGSSARSGSGSGSGSARSSSQLLLHSASGGALGGTVRFSLKHIIFGVATVAAIATIVTLAARQYFECGRNMYTSTAGAGELEYSPAAVATAAPVPAAARAPAECIPTRGLAPIAFRSELGRLLQQEPNMRVGAELGVQHGTFAAETLKDWTNAKKYILVDVWKQQVNASSTHRRNSQQYSAHTLTQAHTKHCTKSLVVFHAYLPPVSFLFFFPLLFFCFPLVVRRQKNYLDAANYDDKRQAEILADCHSKLDPIAAQRGMQIDYMQMFTSEAAKLVPDGSLDYVYVRRNTQHT